MTRSHTIKISARSFLEYIASSARRTRIIKDQVRYYTDPSCQAHAYYGPVLSALKKALSSTQSEAILDACVRRATPERGQQAAYLEIVSGFNAWRSRIRGTGVNVNFATWSNGELIVALRDLLGMRLQSGTELVVLPYVGSQELSEADAKLLLRVLELSMSRVRPGGEPVVLDTRRARSFKLRRNTNRPDLDAALAGETARYVAHWLAASAAA